MRTWILTFALFLGILSSAHAFPRRVLIEEFSNINCPGCAYAASIFHEYVTEHHDEVSVINIHTPYPAPYDPWYRNNAAEHDTLLIRYYYPPTPGGYFDGMTSVYIGDPVEMDNALLPRLQTESPINLELSTRWAPDALEILVEVTSEDEAVTGDYRLRAALLESYAEYDAPSGQRDWHNSLLSYAPDTWGTAFTIDENRVDTLSVLFPWQNRYFDMDSLTVVAYIQSPSTDEVIQSQTITFSNQPAFFVDLDNPVHFSPPGDDVAFELILANNLDGAQQFEVELTSSLPDGWGIIYTTPTGEHSDFSTFALEQGDDFTSSIRFVTTDQASLEGRASLTFTSIGPPELVYTADLTARTSSEVLFIDNNPDDDSAEWFHDAIAEAGEPWNIHSSDWSIYDQDLNFGDLLPSGVQLVIWDFGLMGDIGPVPMAGLRSYLDAGGNLMLTGDSAPVAWSAYYLTSDFGYYPRTIQENPPDLAGINGDEIGDGLTLSLNGGDGAGNSRMPWSMIQSEEGGTISFQFDESNAAMIRSEDETGRKFAVLGFPFEAIDQRETRVELMRRLLTWFLDLQEVSVDEELSSVVLPDRFEMQKAYPNPFNPSVTIPFVLPKAGEVSIAVFNVLGQQVFSNQQNFQSGYHSFVFDTGSAGQELVSGVYFLRVDFNSQVSTQKVMLLR